MDHLSAYAALFHQEANGAGAELLQRVVAWLLAVLAGVVFLGLAGTAAMLGVMHHQFSWALVIVPGLALLLVLASVLFALRPSRSERFPELKAQFHSDAQALRAAA